MTKWRSILFGVCWLASLFVAYALRPDRVPAGAAVPQPDASADGTPLLAGGPRVARRTMDDLLVPGKGDERDVPQLLAQVRGRFAGPTESFWLSEQAAAFAPLLDLPEADLPAALAEVERHTWSAEQKILLYHFLLSQWAERNGPAALDYLEHRAAFPVGASSWNRSEVRDSLWQAWGASDPDGAWQWQQTHYPDDSMLAVHLVLTEAPNNWDEALRRLETFNPDTRRYALEKLCGFVEEEGPRRRLLEQAALLPPEARAMVYRSLVLQWMAIEPAAARAWIASRPENEQEPLREAAEEVKFWK